MYWLLGISYMFDVLSANTNMLPEDWIFFTSAFNFLWKAFVWSLNLMFLIRSYMSFSKCTRRSFCGGVRSEGNPKFCVDASLVLGCSKKCTFHLTRFKKLSTFSVSSFI